MPPFWSLVSLGATGRVDLPQGLEILTDPLVIFAAGAMYLVEFFADKVPGFDTVWDTLHTFIRIPAGAMLAAGAVGDIGPGAELAAALVGGGLAAVTHAAKSGTRVLINTSPEPFTNWTASVTEDVGVVAGLWAAVMHPAVFLVLLVLFLVLVAWLLPRLWRGGKRVFGAIGRLFGAGKGGDPGRCPGAGIARRSIGTGDGEGRHPPGSGSGVWGMKVYLVGGAVRDRLLGRPAKERDYVVVGATAADLLSQGFVQVGRDFPVFLHPQTKDEYALARTERKTAPGYHGFAIHADPDVTLGEDLLRRDLTINALAQDETGQVIDPYGGLADLDARVLRHVSPAFAEDPVRILRVARFAARFADLGFSVAPETLNLMRAMVAAGEVDALVPERVWTELAKALAETTPSRFFETLRACGALARLFPEVERLWGIPQPARWHPEIDTGVHTMMVVDMAAHLSPDLEVRFAALTHDLGKGTTPAEILPSHKGHEGRSVGLIEALCGRLRAPRRFLDLARIVARYHGQVHKLDELRPRTVLDLLAGADAFRRPDRFDQMVTACEADFRGRGGYADLPYPQGERLRRVFAAVGALDLGPIVAGATQPAQVPMRIREARIAVVRRALADGY